ncbi:MAG: hypothetical protein QNK92_10565 [Amylibacter sp.]
MRHADARVAISVSGFWGVFGSGENQLMPTPRAALMTLSALTEGVAS